MNQVVPHNPAWTSEFQRESATISTALGDTVSTLHHIGSTSIPGIHAKPIIDILVEVNAIASVDSNNSAMMDIGYECMGEYGIAGRRYFRKTDPQGTRTHHVHVFTLESDHVIRHLAFRDYLIAHPATAQEYSTLKQTLAANHKNDWGLYLDGKDTFIKKTELIALDWYKKTLN